jgi:hypothetical protein
MRERFVTELVKEVLGPRFGTWEELNSNPLNEYITGVLGPISGVRVRDIDADAEIPAEDVAGYEEEIEGEAESPFTFSPALDPRRRPPVMGISFSVRSEEIPGIKVCLTWARYFREDKKWKRRPRWATFDLELNPGSDHDLWFGEGGKTTPDSPDAEISLHTLVRQERNQQQFVSIYLVNRVPVDRDKKPETPDHIFQPQIRVVCMPGTIIVPKSEGGPAVEGQEAVTEEEVLEFLYRERKVLARGHLCSAVWKEIDWESKTEVARPDSQEDLREIPFSWSDGVLLPDDLRRVFMNPDVRTEFVPLYTIPAPLMDWREEYGKPPELSCEALAEMWDPDELHAALNPLMTAYSRWIEAQEEYARSLRKRDHRCGAVADELLNRSKLVLRRMEEGLKMLCSDEEVRLAFCFANKAMDLQARWSRGKGLVWRPFQLAFILTVLESIANPRSSYRETCDLLWVPTGAGKTEAYLALIVFMMGLRRRLSLSGRSTERTGAGVCAISRYTLRLLTIQQFRRTLAAVTACEYLRVYNLEHGRDIGWRPRKCGRNENFIWGSTPFSAGLWVGGGVRPNMLQNGWSGNRTIYGALSILKGEDQGKGEGEPAQILNCPACGTLLAVPEGGLVSGKDHTLYLLVQVQETTKLSKTVQTLKEKPFSRVQVNDAAALPCSTTNYCTLRIQIRPNYRVHAKDIDHLWNEIRSYLESQGTRVSPVSARPSRMGYFIRYFLNERGKRVDYDFEIFCPNPNCPLHRPWCGGAPAGWICRTQQNKENIPSNLNGISLPDGNRLISVQEPFCLGSPYLGDRIPIPALIVDDQIYHRIPSVIVATVDKFARLPFEPRASAIFGNVTHYHQIYGFYRTFQHQSGKGEHPSPSGRSGRNLWVEISRLSPPDIILQDELHLVEGPLGSLVGIYETAIDHLSRGDGGSIPKYIASTATIRRAREQVRAIFLRDVSVFPPHGMNSDDRFFITEREGHVLDERPGRLYMGLCAPGRGPLTPIVRIWSRLLQTAWLERASAEDVDGYWTLTGYFNAVRELAGARALYRQDIPQRIREISAGHGRGLPEEGSLELSSRTPSTDLPTILDLLERQCPDAVDALFTTSMFGTGVDIQRLALMVVHGQPKTTSAYIQSTGRVGRRRGALVVVFYRASRPRDLSHYEFFCGYHRQLHRFVEPITVYPFSPGVVERALGPVLVSILRNMSGTSLPWHQDETAACMAQSRSIPELAVLPELLETRAERQPPLRRPHFSMSRMTENSLDRWRNVAIKIGEKKLLYAEYSMTSPPQHPVVLGDPQHRHANQEVVYENVPQSLREIEETAGFGVQDRAKVLPQHIRPSQFIFTYGPGAILETPAGPCVIPDPDIGLFEPLKLKLEDFEISDQRITKGLLGGARIFRLPSNAELGHPENSVIYATRPFPEWKLCLNRQGHGGDFDVLYEGRRCPCCRNPSREGREAIRFIQACSGGHMDDVDWFLLVHGDEHCRHADWFRWYGGGGTLRDIKIECPRCGRTVSLGDVYSEDIPCTGRYPEREEPNTYSMPYRLGGCERRAKIIQRQASNLRVPDLVTLLSIPPRHTHLHRILQREAVLCALIGRPPASLTELDRMLHNLADAGKISLDAVNEVLSCPWEEIQEAIREVTGTVRSSSYRDLILEEFHALMNGSVNGIPPVRGPVPQSPVVLEINPHLVREISGPNGTGFRVTPVLRLLTITVQRGYRRVIETTQTASEREGETGILSELVPTSIPDPHNPDQKWYPGVELLGEGIFITLNSDGARHPELVGSSALSWMEAYKNPASYKYSNVFRDPNFRDELHPVFVWWHTLSHSLIRTIATEAGYSSASIRERVYFEGEGSSARGGVLLYAAQPGRDGTLGGMIALVPHMDFFLSRALQNIEICSSDPLCVQSKFRAGQYNGAACYACTLLSETSCEHRNMWLDRNVVLENHP